GQCDGADSLIEADVAASYELRVLTPLLDSEWNGAAWVSSRCCQAGAGVLPRNPQERIRLRASLAGARFIAVRSGSHTVTGNRAEHNLDETLSSARGHLCQLAVKGCQRLAGPLQAHLARHHPVPE